MVPIIYGGETETGDIQECGRVTKLFFFQSNLYDINPVLFTRRQSETKRGRWPEDNPSVHTKIAVDGEKRGPHGYSGTPTLFLYPDLGWDCIHGRLKHWGKGQA